MVAPIIAEVANLKELRTVLYTWYIFLVIPKPDFEKKKNTDAFDLSDYSSVIVRKILQTETILGITLSQCARFIDMKHKTYKRALYI